MTEKKKSAKREDLEAQAGEFGIAFDDSWTNGALETAILEAMEGEVAAEAGPAEPEAAVPEPEPEGPKTLDSEVEVKVEAEKVQPIEAVHNKLVAYGIAKEECPSDIEECELLLQQVLAARKAASEKRKKRDEGDYYGKMAKVRITKLGDNKVGTGRYISGIGNLYYAQGQTPTLPLLSAEALEEKGFAEILERKG